MPLAAHHRCWLAAAGLLAALSASAQHPLPAVPARQWPEVLAGNPVEDPYRAPAGAQAPAVARWMQAQADHASAQLRGSSGRALLREKIERYEGAAAARVAAVTRLPGGVYVYWRRAAADEAYKLVQRNGLQGRETVVFDPMPAKPRSGTPPTPALQAAASPDGRLVALLLPATGAPAPALLRVLDLRSGRAVGRDVPRAVPGGISWLPDGSGLFFQRLQAAGPGSAAPGAAPQRELVFMKAGAHEAGIRTVLRAGDSPGITAAETATLDVQPDGRALLLVHSSAAAGLKLWHSTAAAVLDGKADWKPLADLADQVTAVALNGDRFYVLTRSGAPRLKLVGGRLDSHTVTTAPVLLPEGEAVLTGLAAASDALYVAALEGNLMQLLRRPYRDDAVAVELPVPALGRFTLGAANARADLPGLLLHLRSWTRAPQVFLLGADGRYAATGLQASGPYDAPGDLLATEVRVDRPGGAAVPLTLIHKADVPLDGNNPVLLIGPAGAGAGDEPAFSAGGLAWLEAGGVWAITQPRATGLAAEGVQDLIASAEWLVAQRWTRASRLALWGRSAGAGLVAQAVHERPELFAAVVAEVAAAQALNNGDPPLALGPATPSVAHLMAAARSGKPVLLQRAADIGAGAGAAFSRERDAQADRYAFVLWHLGVPGFTAAR